SLNSGTSTIESLDIDIGPGDVHQISNVHNWYSASTQAWYVSSYPHNVTFYLLEESRSGEKVLETCLNTSYFYFRLPYRITDTLQIASWTICLENPYDNETIHFEALNLWIEDAEILALWSVHLPYVLPSSVLICMYMYIPMIIAYQGEGNLKKILGNKVLFALTLMLVGIYLFFASPFIFAGSIMLYRIPIIPLIVDMVLGYSLLSKRQKLRQVENI
ncbi:MAG: hypothetical protein ACXAEF_02000, partial [Candidatus Thorarchaeota archaeon]